MVLFVVDPLAGLRQRTDTSLGLMRSFEAAGDEVRVAYAADLTLRGDRPWVDASRWTAADPAVRGRREPIPLDRLGCVFVRVEPPVDTDYLAMTRVLDHVERSRTTLVNEPAALREIGEHVWALRFPGLAPDTLVTADAVRLAAFVDEHRRAVLKPVDGFGGAGVVLAVAGDPNLTSLWETATRHGRRLVVAQRWLPAVESGNRRLFLLDGRPFGPVVLRMPAAPDFRIGPPSALTAWSAQDLAVAARTGPVLAAAGARFVGLDVIDGQVIDVNVTSPGALRKADLLAGTTRWCDGVADHFLRDAPDALPTVERSSTCVSL